MDNCSSSYSHSSYYFHTPSHDLDGLSTHSSTMPYSGSDDEIETIANSILAAASSPIGASKAKKVTKTETKQLSATKTKSKKIAESHLPKVTKKTKTDLRIKPVVKPTSTSTSTPSLKKKKISTTKKNTKKTEQIAKQHIKKSINAKKLKPNKTAKVEMVTEQLSTPVSKTKSPLKKKKTSATEKSKKTGGVAKPRQLLQKKSKRNTKKTELVAEKHLKKIELKHKKVVTTKKQKTEQEARVNTVVEMSSVRTFTIKEAKQTKATQVQESLKESSRPKSAEKVETISHRTTSKIGIATDIRFFIDTVTHALAHPL